MSENEVIPEEACACTNSFGQIVWSSECSSHERCPTTMRGVPIQCILAEHHLGNHR